MPLPSSGNSISLSQMEDYSNDGVLDNDADTSSPIGINDSNIRGLLGKASGQTMSFSDFFGLRGVPAKDVSITVGVGTYFYATWSGQQTGVTNPSLGSVSVTARDGFYLPINWRGLYHTATSNPALFLRLNQGSNSDLVVSKITIQSNGFHTFHRSDATYSNLGGGDHQWSWDVSSTPFGSANSTATVVWFAGS